MGIDAGIIGDPGPGPPVPVVSFWLARFTGAGEGVEQEGGALAHPGIGIEDDPAGRVMDRTNRERQFDLSAPGAADDSALQPRPKEVEFGLRHMDCCVGHDRTGPASGDPTGSGDRRPAVHLPEDCRRGPSGRSGDVIQFRSSTAWSPAGVVRNELPLKNNLPDSWCVASETG